LGASSRALAAARARHAEELEFWRFTQFCFDRQWAAVKRYANERGVKIVGDMPIFVAHHSVDCWSRPELYLLDEGFMPEVIAGVPPDFFSKTGQRWGNPLYDWGAMRRDGYGWWVARLRRQLRHADMVRFDHFGGLRRTGRSRWARRRRSRGSGWWGRGRSCSRCWGGSWGSCR
ncbi:MAG: 4-alpha-glucanotransferase, partial [Deltaproteobacteria bacterium]|nr:4-alpha-glucanotransferase [Deltaproteobacteria bacterium]